MMAINWNSVKPEHVSRACDSILASGAHPKVKARGIAVQYNDQPLPAKQVLKLAYQIANGPGSGIGLDFASGEGTVRMLKAMGFVAGRVEPDGLRVE
jgi:hypothetical protein